MTCKGPLRPRGKTEFAGIQQSCGGGGLRKTKPFFREKQFKVIHNDT